MRATGRLGWLLAGLPLAASGCFDAPVPTPDASLSDLPSTDRSSPRDARDAADVADVSDVSDVPAALDIREVGADLGPRCTTSADCAPGDACCAGSCVDVQSDLGHCGACGRRCAVSNGLPACAAGACGIAACTVGFADCNHDLADGCESDLQGDPARCGSCDVSCPTPPGAGSIACAAGRCGYVCAAGMADCDGDARNGCERPVSSDARNCGRCGEACPARPGASVPRCESGRCGYTCDVGRGDCDGDGANGCETDVRASLANCGLCGSACAAPANAVATCAAGRCGYTCDAGHGDCDRAPANGCETDLATSPANCGACGVVGAEVCDGRDNSCDGVADNGCPRSIGGLAGFDFTSPEYGTGTGTSTSASCAAGQVVRGIFGRVNGSLVTQLNVICGTAQITEDRTTTPFRYAATLSGATDVGTVGTAVGTVFRYQCPGDSVVTRIRGRASPYLYQFMVDCSTLAVTGNPGSLRITATPLATSPAFGSATGGTFDYPCPTDATGSASVLRGLFGRPFHLLTSIYSTSVGARCSVPSITVR